MATGYEEIDKYIAQRNQGFDTQEQKMNDIVDKQVQLETERLERQKEGIDRDTIQQNKAIYQDYRKNSNPFGAQAENLAGQGLGRSGYAETTQANLYNTYQQNITATLNASRQLKSDVDFAINEAIKTGDITKGQNALELFKQRMQLLSEEYDLRNNREQFLYQKEQDALRQTNWEREFQYNQDIDNRNFEYQKSRDKVSDEQWNKTFKYQQKRDKISDAYQKSRDKVSDKQWQKEYELSKKARASSSRRSSGGSRRSYSSKSSKTTSINLDDGNNTTTKNNKNDALKKVLEKADSLLKKTKSGRVAQAVAKTAARQFIYRAVENGTISDKEAGTVYKKLGLEK